MKKREKTHIICMVSLFLLISVGLLLLMIYRNNLPVATVKCLEVIIVVLYVMVVIGTASPYIWKGVLGAKRAVHNVNACDDEIFEKIDSFSHILEENNFNNINLIQLINWYYRDGGQVDELVTDREFDRLFKRLDFLHVQQVFFSDSMTLWCSMAISLLASCMIQVVSEVTWFSYLGMLVFFGLFFLVLLSKYSFRGQMGSFSYYVQGYEEELLKEKIKKLEFSLRISDRDAQILNEKRAVIEALKKKGKRTKSKGKKEELKKDTMCLQKLNLCLKDYSDCYFQKVSIDGIQTFLIYDLERGKENNYMGYDNLKSDSYMTLLAILERNGTVEYIL